jgi:P-type Cu+ transporter
MAAHTGSSTQSSALRAPHATTPEPTVTAVSAVEPDRPAPMWICPVCPGVLRDRPGNCPACGLALDPAALPLEAEGPDPELRSLSWRLKLGVLLALPLVGMGLADLVLDDAPLSKALGPKGYQALQALLCTPVVLVCGWPILVRGWRSIRTGRANVFTLAGIAVTVAYIFSLFVLVYLWLDIPLVPRFPEAPDGLRPALKGSLEVFAPYRRGMVDPFFEGAAVLVLLLLLGQVLERRARSRTGAAIRKLVRLTPKTARVVLSDGGDEERPLDVVRAGDLVRVRPGEWFPVDGIIRDGDTTVDESLLTGEVMPTSREPGEEVLAGTVNGLGTVTVEVRRVGFGTALAHVIALVDRAQRGRVPLQRAADRMAAWFVPAVLLSACATYIAWIVYGLDGSATTAAVCAVGVLVAACPVTLGLATPTAVVVGMARATRAGVLFRDGAALERLAAVDTVLFDKTGTLTQGRMKLLAIHPSLGRSAEEVIALAAAVERGSDHPIGLAIVWEAVRRGVDIPVAADVETVVGYGVRGRVNGAQVVVGRVAFLKQSNIHFDLMYSEAGSHRALGHAVVFVGEGERCVGVIALEDPIRPQAAGAVAALKTSRTRVVLLSGDDEETARTVANTLAIPEVVADTVPAEKYAVVQRLKNEGRVVAMCGDGINDAPALAAADVGIAVGTGTEAALTIAGVALVRPDLRGVAAARRLSRATVRTIRQNLTVAFIYTLLAIPVAAGALTPLGGGLVSPIWAAIAVTAGSLLILANSLRLGRVR